MRGIVTIDINERLKPGVNADVSRFYTPGEVVEVVKSVFGDPYDGEDLWYLLNNGNYIWSGGVDVTADCSALPLEDRDHFLVSYRTIHPDGRPNLDTKNSPDELFFSPIRLPADTESVRVNRLNPALFADGVMQSVHNVSSSRKHVFVYIHGYQLFSSLKLDLLSNFVMSYLTHPNNAIAKMLFFAWPGQGGPSRKTVDDRSLRAGANFTEHNLFEAFTQLSKRLKEEGKFLNLIVHSFGHQLLNGMINPKDGFEKNIPNGIFENIFLMAPDISHVTVKKEGKTLRNYFKDSDGEDYKYDFSRLTDLGNHVHVFHNKYDYLLYSSTKKFVEKGDLKRASSSDARFKITADYMNLGNYGYSRINYNELESGFNTTNIDDLIKRGLYDKLQPKFTFHDVEDLVARGERGDLTNFPFRSIRGRKSGDRIEDVWKSADYDGINAGKIIFNLNRFPNHHRYLFTCKPVVDKVQEILNTPTGTLPIV